MRLARRHRLVPSSRAASVAEAAASVVGLHATDPASVYLAAWARMREPSLAAVDREIYEQHALVRMLAMRRTVFVFPAPLVDAVHAGVSLAVAREQRRRLNQLVSEAGIATDPAAWLAPLEAAMLAAVDRRGEATAAELSADVPELQTQLRLAVGKVYEGAVSVGTRLLVVLAAEGRLIRGRPRGSWVSTQYRWTTPAAWLGRELAELPVAAAQAEVADIYLRRFGPAPETDLRWWTGWTGAESKRALAAAEAVEVELEGGVRAYVAAGDDELEPELEEPWAALLPALDPTVMGWQARGWFLGAHGARLFDRSGNAGPTVWWDGRVVGGWAFRPGGEVAYRLLEDVRSQATLAIETEASRLASLVNGTSIIPRFRTPLEKELSG